MKESALSPICEALPASHGGCLLSRGARDTNGILVPRPPL